MVAHSNPVLVPGKLNKAVQFDGNKQYLDVGNLDNCFGDLAKCSHGFTGSFFFNFKEHKDGKLNCLFLLLVSMM